MTAWSASLPKDFVYPATAGLVVVLVTILLLFLSSTKAKKLWKKSTKGTKFVTTEDGTVRRSTRSRKTVARWSPEELGSGTPTNKQGSSSVSPPDKVTPKSAPKPVKVESPVDDTPKRGPGRPRKTPPNEKAPSSPPTSPVRTRRGAKTPAK